ncbi:MAG TPA: hypothetical protein VK085_07755 [Pseudogracilibacillus sp.]|nr:hypothetical protein [Pseudogracilibacillus sp.]
MIGCLKKSVQTGRKITIIYLSESGSISKRIIQVISYRDEHIIAFCYVRNQLRTFKIGNILAVEQSEQKMEAYVL